jgi:hypothetical protein
MGIDILVWVYFQARGGFACRTTKLRVRQVSGWKIRSTKNVLFLCYVKIFIFYEIYPVIYYIYTTVNHVQAAPLPPSFCLKYRSFY